VFADMQLIEQLYKPELAFLPIGGLYTMSPYEAALALKLLQVNKMVPMHYGTFPALTGTPEELSKLALGTEVWTLEPGVTVDW
jgi:L-ascorbate metabolism protein UlaG (beta-lactamase superfamily)